MNQLKLYALTDQYRQEASLYEGLEIGRIIAQHRGSYVVITEDMEMKAEISGKMRYEASEKAQLPAVGDFVMISHEQKNSIAIIHYILTRKSAFLRVEAGSNDQAQVVATNIDTVFLCMSLNKNYNLNRMERYLSIAWDSGATPVIVLTKSDLCENHQEIIEEIEGISFYSDIITTSMFEDNVDKFIPYLQEGMTAAFIGSSGVGKTTLINQLLRNKSLETKEISKGDKGKHTTTGRELFLSSYGGVVIDTPGMRELGALSVDLSKSFSDIDELASQCKFNDCSHSTEPGCAVQKALLDGLIDKRRLDSYFKLKIETTYDGLNSKQIEKQKIDRMFKEVGGMKKSRKNIKNKRKMN
ncbi:MAG: ribosome small subunit-dependent GTPase A [Gallicola sp.]|nr:ribosome small subunit-dependent GTPase A [Gallicola sp.]